MVRNIFIQRGRPISEAEFRCAAPGIRLCNPTENCIRLFGRNLFRCSRGCRKVGSAGSGEISERHLKESASRAPQSTMRVLWAHSLSSSSSFPGVSVQLWSGRCRPGSLVSSRSCKRRFPFVSANEKAEEEGEGGDGKGDQQVQDALVGMVRLQAGKLRVSEFVDERSKLLSEIADQAKEEYDRIAQDAMRSMDEASSKIISSVDAEAQAMEEELASARAQMEADSRELDEFEENVDRARSEGLFFKSLYGKPLKAWKDRSPEEKQTIHEEAKVVYNVAQKSGSSRTRRFLYGVLIFLLSLSLLEAVSNGDYPWPKLALYSLILVALVAQLTYESFVASNEDDSQER